MDKKKWKGLEERYKFVKQQRISNLFDDERRFEKFSAEAAGIFLDYSKTNVDDITKELLLELINGSDVSVNRAAMFAGDKVNFSENRPAIHTALRSSQDELTINNQNVMDDIKKTYKKMSEFSKDVRSGKLLSSTGDKFTDIVNIGIGGSDLGPKMVTNALRPYHDGPNCHFVSNIDGADIHDTLSSLNAKNTLIIIASKTFTTSETMMNAEVAIKWLADKVGVLKTRHLIAISSCFEETIRYGISADRVFSFSNWIGGRYSIWGPIGLVVMIAIGEKNFRSFLQGAGDMDKHFCEAPNNKNLPILLAMIGIWHRNLCNYATRAVLPYENRLGVLPEYLQQLDMESNGKHVTQNGSKVINNTAPVVWGEPGTNGQHAFYQMIHQGTSIIPCEFLVGANGHEPYLRQHHKLLIANCLAQSESLMNGSKSDSSNPHLQFSGNRPSVTILYEKLTPRVLGSLLSMFEHRTFVESSVWSVNPFDQWGVELGKKLSNEFLTLMGSGANLNNLNSSTRGLFRRIFNY